MFELLDTLPMPLIGRVHGAALGGGVGLAAVCDIVVAADDAVFGFTETKLGILPAVISPFVLREDRRLGGARAVPDRRRGSMRSARARSGSCTQVVPAATLDDAVERYVREILTAAPSAIAAAKDLIARDRWQPPGGRHRRDDQPHRRAARVGRRPGRHARVPREAEAEMGSVA